MVKNWKALLVNLAIPLAVGAAGSFLAGGYSLYGQLHKPPLSPPGWVFPVVWTALYLLMGYGAYRVYISQTAPAEKKQALRLYGLQLAVNLLWPVLFFGGQFYLAAFLWLLLLWALVYLTIRRFSAIDEKAGDTLLPYLLWITYAAYLNLGIFLLN